MIIIGANICVRPSGKQIRDAGACLSEDGKVKVAIAEERITRNKHDYTIRNSIYYCLDYCGFSLQDVDLFVFSICGAKTPSKEYVRNYLLSEGISIPLHKIDVCPSHHLSHASSSFYASGFHDSLILVADRDGSIINGDEKEIYANSVEHISYYIGSGNEITLLDRDDDLFGDLGLGLGYSYVTEWLGFDGHAMAGKTMALAAYGRSGAFPSAHIFQLNKNKIHCLLEPTDNNKSLAVRRLIYNAAGVDIGAHCLDYSSANAFDVSRLVQDDLENVVIQRLKALKEETGMTNLCFAGGVALNCRLNYLIHKSKIFDNVFIQPAAGDTGQCLGNALWGYHQLCKQPRGYMMDNAYLGKPYTGEEIVEALKKHDTEIIIDTVDETYNSITDLLLSNKIIGWFQGRSEFGPRALGNRSILASPLSPTMRDRLNERVKHREWFRPFGVSIINDSVNEYFDFDRPSPYMLIAPQTHESKINAIPSAVHVDGSCRIHTVTPCTNDKLHKLLQAFQCKSGIPILINTSFNNKGEPIVETPEDAIKCFLGTGIDCLVIDQYVITKKTPHL